MRWLIQWLLEDLHRLFNPWSGELRALRAGLARARRRTAYHEEKVRKAWDRVRDLTGRVAVLEMAEDTDVDELVAVRRTLMGAEEEAEHHVRRLQELKDAVSRMHLDRKRMQGGAEPEHREAYRDYLDR